MATGLVKWWRARFLAGYKPFSVVGGIAEGSDSEELLAGSVGSPCNSSPLPPPPHHLPPSPETTVSSTSQSINLEFNQNGGHKQQQTSSCCTSACGRTSQQPQSPAQSQPPAQQQSQSQSQQQRPLQQQIQQQILQIQGQQQQQQRHNEQRHTSLESPLSTCQLEPPSCQRGRFNDESSQIPNLQPSGRTTSQGGSEANTAKPQLSFDEFECDVSVAENNGTEGNGRRRQEFSFTLYDFDGHGKITKDDIAGLVTTIYDTLGASIQVPPCGSKTIKVKLTVSPDKSTQTNNHGNNINTNNGKINNLQTTNNITTTTMPPSSPPPPPPPPPCCHAKIPVSACGHANNSSHVNNRRIPRRRRVPRNRVEPERANESHSEDDADNVPPAQLINNTTTKQEELRKRIGPMTTNFPSPYSNSSEGDISDDDASDESPQTITTPLTPLVNNHRKRSGSMQRQQLLEIIQANMEKNNLSFHASRKRHQIDHLRVPAERPYTDASPGSRQAHSYHHHHHHKPVRDYSHPSSLPKLSSKNCRGNLRKNRNRDTTNTTTTTTTTAPPTTGKSLRNNLQSTPNPNILNQDNHNNHINQMKNDIDFTQCGNKGSKKHQQKHATREQDQARAMAQVVRWLEREFSQNSGSNNNNSGGRRHVHEHIHHHYHHYHAEALV